MRNVRKKSSGIAVAVSVTLSVALLAGICLLLLYTRKNDAGSVDRESQLSQLRQTVSSQNQTIDEQNRIIDDLNSQIAEIPDESY